MPSVSLEERAKIVSLYRHEIKQRQISRRMNWPLSAINKVCQAFRDDGRLWNLPHGHSQRSTDSAKDLVIVQAAKKAPFITARQIKDSLNLSASMSTIRRWLHDKGLRSRVPAQKPALSEANKLARLAYAQKNAAWTVEDWRCVIFIDESTFSTRWDQRQRIWRTDNARSDILSI